MLSNQTFLSSLTRFSILSLGVLASFGMINRSPILAQMAQSNFTLANGVYLYGQSPEAEEIGQEYLVFKVHQGKVIGAIYLPQSEFNCFSGTLTANQMNLSIIDPNDGKKYPYPIAMKASSPVASQGQVSSEVILEGYHRLTKISNNDHRILKTCLQPN
ncbi:hypothetical protein [Aphanothece sacrum]|uniref:Uncharacterized protein n=1 Tax=Aphanothece sacrum FPU1 TaxID=1920663 RepID=A0A401ICT9_APHSA|nr:hypothetical protein [Aphanothece sacrum]GBF79056.1 hypothetical protein AsFPU1_0448 [Aphanothece sacrum FPU1]GBF86015.1 hypothetical protein AsFPU3_3085 [Aphanothece sacrum FPU3]